MFYVLICISLTFVGIAGLQFLYLAYLERVEMEHKKRIKELERHCKHLKRQIEDAEIRLSEQSRIIADFYEDDEEEIWADVIEER